MVPILSLRRHNRLTTNYTTVEATGGSPYLQQHRHTTVYGDYGTSGGTIGTASNSAGTGAAVYTGNVDTSSTGGSVSVGNAGNMPPYITCYMYKRTA